jgi:hypothetical protein
MHGQHCHYGSSAFSLYASEVYEFHIRRDCEDGRHVETARLSLLADLQCIAHRSLALNTELCLYIAPSIINVHVDHFDADVVSRDSVGKAENFMTKSWSSIQELPQATRSERAI